MSTKTILNFKVDKKLKVSAKDTVPVYRPSKLLVNIIKEAEKDFNNNNFIGPFRGVSDLIKNLNSN